MTRISPLRLELFLKGVKQIDIARKAGVDPAFICRIVAGKQKPSEKVINVFRRMGLDVEENAG